MRYAIYAGGEESNLASLEHIKALVQNHIARQPGRSPYRTQADGLILLQSEPEAQPTHMMHQPALCVVVQGAKWTAFGEQRLDYRAGQAMITSLETPGFSQVVEGGDGEPYYGLIVQLNLPILREVYEALGRPPIKPSGRTPDAIVVDLDERVLGCVRRMLEALAHADGVPILYPGLMRELCYLLLSSPYASALARPLVSSRETRGLIGAVRRIQHHYDQPLPLSQLARESGYSLFTFHRKFKALTSMTPLAYQKRLRLIEARRLMIAEQMSAEEAGFKVGYASPSQFNREYARMFQASPRKDVRTQGKPTARQRAGKPGPDGHDEN
ncbi:MAG: AraC family transcriptional regulator [Geminicoccaceae bacterium]